MKKSKIIAVLITTALFMAFALGSSSSGSSTGSTGTPDSTGSNTAEIEEEDTKEEEAGAKTLGIGEEFGNKTIKGVVIYADLDFKDYNDIWTQVEEGKKAVYIKIKVTNISDKSNYVSVGDFDCYVDNVATNPELVSGGDEDYNANIEAGRSAVLGAMYIVPEDAENIELEYKPFGERADRQIIVIQDESTTGTILEADESAADIEEGISDDIKVLSVGEEFGNKTIKGVVTNVDLDYKNYNELWTSIPDGKKAIYILIKVTNISNEPNYVSVGDFDCYVDDVSVNPELVSGGDEDYNANIEAGRSAVLGAMYVIPKDAGSIELEYNPIGESAERAIIKIK